MKNEISPPPYPLLKKRGTRDCFVPRNDNHCLTTYYSLLTTLYSLLTTYYPDVKSGPRFYIGAYYSLLTITFAGIITFSPILYPPLTSFKITPASPPSSSPTASCKLGSNFSPIVFISSTP